MDSFNDVMDAVKAYCKGRVSDASYRVFIQDLNLLNFEGTNIIILEVPNDVVMRFAAARYADLLKEAFASILGFEVELKFVLAAPAPDGGKAAEKPKLDENDLPSGRYEFTFENFIKGPSNQFAFATRISTLSTWIVKNSRTRRSPPSRRQRWSSSASATARRTFF